ncbi:hypothetical protein GCM10011391_11470 [Pullulanibacillus camelliae]|uniref:S1 motif domain-containing protein n=1 Tax=Pullulanibacillus camelliae TaxID=1707096 RepID=A0A8J2VND1_9BACL|nr:Tex family protein [Pullulanibacillus camelliae]GGE34491.1 hypothetical protein GCM10011391_11470 [Pullulanibacillus camelliae]
MTDDKAKASIIQNITQSLKLKRRQVENVIDLLENDNTIPFIARYRKEFTGGLDEVAINAIAEQWQYAQTLHKRKEEVQRLITEQGKLTKELETAIEKATKLQEIEDIYRPYKQKRRTRATVAKEKGLEPLADWLMSCPDAPIEPQAEVFISEEKEVLSVEEALEGACDIIAERLSDDAENRKRIRQVTFAKGIIVTERKNKAEDEKGIYEMYYNYEEKVDKIVPHRVLAINRGEKDDVLKVNIRTPEEEIVTWLEKQLITSMRTTAKEVLASAAKDSYKRLISPAIEREIRQSLTEKAETQAIKIFSENLQHLLMQPPMKDKRVLGVDPAYRTGCKLAVVDETGKMLEIAVIYPTPPRSEIDKSKTVVKQLIDKYDIDTIAIGNGTASRETEQFIADVIKELQDKNIYYLIVNEAGASVYSASELAREEFPDLKVEERSAVSIARRLQDPLAELVKIDPKSVGVGQYQHDVSQKELSSSLQFVVETVVNRVGVNVNTASSSLLQYVAGLSKTVANNIVKRRDEEGRYKNRQELQKVPRLGGKTFEQCAGFLTIPDGDIPLDRTPIHPESYKETFALLENLGLTAADIGTDGLKEKLNVLDVQKTAEILGIGEPTLRDIVQALMRPGRDPREDVEKPLLRTDVLEIKDLKPGMALEGTVRNVVDFGAFVDIGVKQDGLVHISKLSNGYVKHPMDVVHVGEIVKVWVEDVDVNKGRIALTMVQS